MKIKKDWWKNFFNDTYLVTDARSVCDSSLTSCEASLLEKFLKTKKDDKLLDLCGGHGRHSLELARRGYKNLTVLDYSGYLIRLGSRMAKEKNVNVKFIKRDARKSRLKDNDYSGVFIMANSFGYFPSNKENLRLLREAYRILKKDGKLLLDLTDLGYVKNHLKPASWHEANNDIVVCRERHLKGNLIKAREVVVSKKKGLIRDGLYSERIYDKKKITKLLNQAGFKNISIKKNISLHKRKKDYGLITSRMFVTAKKG